MTRRRKGESDDDLTRGTRGTVSGADAAAVAARLLGE